MASHIPRTPTTLNRLEELAQCTEALIHFDSDTVRFVYTQPTTIVCQRQEHRSN